MPSKATEAKRQAAREAKEKAALEAKKRQELITACLLAIAEKEPVSDVYRILGYKYPVPRPELLNKATTVLSDIIAGVM
jgi:hypothetical protein